MYFPRMSVTNGFGNPHSKLVVAPVIRAHVNILVEAATNGFGIPFLWSNPLFVYTQPKRGVTLA